MRDDLSQAARERVAAAEPAPTDEWASAPRPWSATESALWTARSPRVLLALTLLTLLVALAPVRPGVSAYLLSAVQARRDYRYDEALALYSQAHAANGDDARPLCASGDIFTLQHLPTQAAAAYRACAELVPGDGSAWLRLGNALASAHDDSGALSAWQRAGAAGDYTGYYRLAERAEGLGQLDTAARWWAQAPQDDPVAQGHLGLLALAQGDVVSARAHFFVVSRSQSAFATQLRDAGVFLLAARPPTSARDQENIGYALLTMGETTLALAPLRRAVQLTPTDGSARAYYGWTLWLLGQRAAARPQIAAGLRYSPSLPFALYAAGQEAQADGHFALALARFQTALEVTPKNAALWSAAGDAALAEAQYVTAELSYSNAALYSNDAAYTVALLDFYRSHALGMDNGTAVQAALAATRRFPTNEPLVFLLGRMYDSLGQQTYATYAFERATTLDPTDPGPWYYLGTYAAANGDVVTAVIDLRTTLALQPTGEYAAKARHALAQFSAYTVGGA